MYSKFWKAQDNNYPSTWLPQVVNDSRNLKLSSQSLIGKNFLKDSQADHIKVSLFDVTPAGEAVEKLDIDFVENALHSDIVQVTLATKLLEEDYGTSLVEVIKEKSKNIKLFAGDCTILNGILSLPINFYTLGFKNCHIQWIWLRRFHFEKNIFLNLIKTITNFGRLKALTLIACTFENEDELLSIVNFKDTYWLDCLYFQYAPPFKFTKIFCFILGNILKNIELLKKKKKSKTPLEIGLDVITLQPVLQFEIVKHFLSCLAKVECALLNHTASTVLVAHLTNLGPKCCPVDYISADGLTKLRKDRVFDNSI